MRRGEIQEDFAADRANSRESSLYQAQRYPREMAERWRHADAASCSKSGSGRQWIAGDLPEHARIPHGRPYQMERSEEHTSELQSLMRISYAVFRLTKKNINTIKHTYN